jgi:hypothetical protein
MKVTIWILLTASTVSTVRFSMDLIPTTAGTGTTGIGMTGTMTVGILPILTGAWVTLPGTVGCTAVCMAVCMAVCTAVCMEAGIRLTAIMAGAVAGAILIPAGIPAIMGAGVTTTEVVTITGMENAVITTPWCAVEVVPATALCGLLQVQMIPLL